MTELRPSARALIDSARRARTPGDPQRERAYQALVASLGGPAAIGTAKVATTVSKVALKSSFIWLKWALPAVLVGAAGLGLWRWSARPAALPPDAPELRVPPASPPAIGPVPSPPSPLEAASAAAPSARPMPSAPTAKAALMPKPSPEDLAQELALLHQALAESRSGHAARALELAQQHAARYPNSPLRLERDAIEVRSLCALGRSAEARKIAARLRSQKPNSPAGAALEETCVGK